VRVIGAKNIAFVRYRFRSSAEFGMTAMANQALGHEEVLNVKWAHDDPDPAAQEAIRRADADAAVAALRARGLEIQDGTKGQEGDQSEDIVNPVSGYDMPAAKRLKVAGQDVGAYPETDGQYPKEEVAVE
jgi:hypothetical protein